MERTMIFEPPPEAPPRERLKPGADLSVGEITSSARRVSRPTESGALVSPIRPFAHSPFRRFAVSSLAPDTLPGHPISGMAHLIQNKKKLLARISRIRGQLNGIEKALDADRDCGEVLLTLAACRGALNSLMAEILEDHVRQHVLGAQSTKDREVAAEELIEVIKRYLK